MSFHWSFGFQMDLGISVCYKEFCFKSHFTIFFLDCFHCIRNLNTKWLKNSNFMLCRYGWVDRWISDCCVAYDRHLLLQSCQACAFSVIVSKKDCCCYERSYSRRQKKRNLKSLFEQSWGFKCHDVKNNHKLSRALRNCMHKVLGRICYVNFWREIFKCWKLWCSHTHCIWFFFFF